MDMLSIDPREVISWSMYEET